MYQPSQSQGYLWTASRPALLPGIDMPVHSGIIGNNEESVCLFSSKYKYFGLRSIVWQD